MDARDLARLGVADLVARYRDRTLSPVETMAATLAHVEATNPALNALFSVRGDEAMAHARGSEKRWRRGEPLGLLDGVPVTVKDSVAVAGWPYFHGIAANRHAPPSTFDAPPAARLKESGAIILAKTTMPDCGLLAAGVSSLFGIVRNPWGRSWNTGGSSAGAGASLAAGMGFLSVGSDIAGSVRLPASQCGIVALKPSQGRIPHLMPDFMRSAGPMGRRTADIARMLAVIGRPDNRDPWALPADDTPYHERLERPLEGLRIGVLTDLGFGLAPEPAVRDTVERAGRALAGEGAAVEPFAPPLDGDCYAPVDRWLQVRGCAEYRHLPPHDDHEFNAEVRAWALRGQDMSAQDAAAALAEIGRWRARLIAAFDGWDYVLAPTLPVVNFPAEAVGVVPEQPLGHTHFTAVFNQTGQPASSVCFGLDGRGLPIGVQVIGHRFDDLGVLQVTHALESLRGFDPDWPVVPRP